MTSRSGYARPLMCPKCDNLPLPGMGNYSVFHCSSCGDALPRGKSKYGKGSSDTFSMNSDEDHNLVAKNGVNNRRFGSSQLHGIPDCLVNGHAIPDCLVKKAERMAGRIRPGDYWYDFRAGFWGIMDGPCLGIIPPMIEEFKYSIPKKCSGGNTGVIVNGRELHSKDLDLLSVRGLPTERGKSYVVEISGRVLDDETGEEIHSLGRLAPTVEKMKRGFGMRVPRRSSRRGGGDTQEQV